MKKIIFISLLFLAVLFECAVLNAEENAAAPQQQEQQQQQKQPTTIDEIEQDCLSKARSSLKMNECSIQARQAWQNEIDRHMNQLKAITVEEDYANILKAQENWKKYQDSEFESIAIVSRKKGSVFQNVAIKLQTNVVKERALELRRLYTILIH